MVETTGRKSKVKDIEAAVATLVPDTCESLWVGGMHMHNVPMALVRECIRQGKRFQTLYTGPSASLAADLLIGSRSVDRVVCGYRIRAFGTGPCVPPCRRRRRER